MARSKMIKVERTEKQKRDGALALYVRVSTDRQAEEGYSIEVQRERLAAHAVSLGLDKTRIEYYIDDGYSGGSLDRPEMSRLIHDVKSGTVSQVFVYKLDRLSRSQKDTLYLIEDIFLPHNVDFVSIQESFNTSTPFGRAVVGILSVFAQFERENIYERTRIGMQKRIEDGYWPGGGRIPYGYNYDKEQGTLIPNEDAENVRRIYDLYIKGYSLQRIADMLNLKYEKLAYQIITRKSNAGYIVYNGVEYLGRHEPIISLETYEKAMAIMMDRSSKRFVSTTEHLLTGLVYCGVCGAKMRYQKWGNAGSKFVCYSQQKSKSYLVRDPHCDNVKPWADGVEDAVISDLFKMTKQNIESAEELVEPMNALEMLYAQYDGVARKLKRLYSLYADSGNEILLEAVEELKMELAGIGAKIKTEEEKGFWSRNIQHAKEELKSIAEVWEYMTLHERQNAVRSVVERIIVTGHSIHVEYKF